MADTEPPSEEPSQPAPLLYVPVRSTGTAMLSLRLGRLAGDTRRTGIAFTSSRRLRLACDPGQEWVRLTTSALRALLRPLGIDRIQLDPVLLAARVPDVPAIPLGTGIRRPGYDAHDALRSERVDAEPARARQLP
jgi:hypothetical protein